MKKLIPIIVLTSAILLSKAAAPVPQTVVACFSVSVDNTQLGGMSTNDFLTNYVVCIYSATSATTQSTNYTLMSATPCAQYFNQGPAGSTWTNQLQTDTQTRFYLMNATNLNGGVGPFSPVAVWVPNTLSSSTLRLVNSK